MTLSKGGDRQGGAKGRVVSPEPSIFFIFIAQLTQSGITGQLFAQFRATQLHKWLAREVAVHQITRGQ